MPPSERRAAAVAHLGSCHRASSRSPPARARCCCAIPTVTPPCCAKRESRTKERAMETKTIAIVGGGFAGATVARCLERGLPEAWQIVLLSRENFITYNPLLPEVV